MLLCCIFATVFGVQMTVGNTAAQPRKKSVRQTSSQVSFHEEHSTPVRSNTDSDNDARVDAQSVFAAVQKLYGEAESLKAQFSTRVADNSKPMRGTLLVKRGNKFRIELAGRIITCNGKVVWNYAQAQSKVIISDFKNNPATMSPEKIFLSFPKTYTPTLSIEPTSRESALRLTLMPSSSRDAVGGMQRVMLLLQPKTYMLRELFVTDEHTTYHWTMTSLQRNAALSDELFEFKPPSGVDVVDLRD
jgi:outer membrane lipoprotein-sorting protein